MEYFVLTNARNTTFGRRKMLEKKTKKAEPSAVLANDKIVVLAAFLAGASKGYADTEDIAVQAARLAPGKFSWRKYPDQINIEVVRRRLTDAATQEKGNLLTGSKKDGWLLTEAGLRFCERYRSNLNEADSDAVFRVTREQPWAARERVRMTSETAYTKWATGEVESITPVEAERFFRIDDYVVGDLRRSRISRARDTFSADTQLSEAIEAITKKVRDRE